MCDLSQPPPFAIGQKVVCLKTSKLPFPHPNVIKDEIYTVACCIMSCCSGWQIGVKELFSHLDRSECRKCGRDILHTGHFVYLGKSKFFAPIEQSYTDIRKELADSMGETKETPDKIIIKEPDYN